MGEQRLDRSGDAGAGGRHERGLPLRLVLSGFAPAFSSNSRTAASPFVAASERGVDAVPVRGIHIGSRSDQRVDSLHVATVDRTMQRCRAVRLDRAGGCVRSRPLRTMVTPPVETTRRERQGPGVFQTPSSHLAPLVIIRQPYSDSGSSSSLTFPVLSAKRSTSTPARWSMVSSRFASGVGSR